jgi:hypothetical protein
MDGKTLILRVRAEIAEIMEDLIVEEEGRGAL